MSGSFRFLKSARTASDWPMANPDQPLVPEVVFLGRSNSGKSSALNRLSGSRVAKVSSSPGKTRLMNFFEGPKYRIVDVPGYGYSSRSGDEQAEWSGMIEPYLRSREELVGAVLLIDSRRKWSEDEGMLGRFIKAQGLPLGIALTKWDKLNQKEQAQSIKHMKEAMTRVKSWKPVFIQPISATSGFGMAELENLVFSFLVQNKNEFRVEEQSE